MDKGPTKNLFADGKVNLSAEAIKSGAHELRRWQQIYENPDKYVINRISKAVIRKVWHHDNAFIPTVKLYPDSSEIKLCKMLTQIYGTSGSGKTEFLNHFVNQASDAGARCLALVEDDFRSKPERTLTLWSENISESAFPEWSDSHLMEIVFRFSLERDPNKSVILNILKKIENDTSMTDILIIDNIIPYGILKQVEDICLRISEKGVWVFFCSQRPAHNSSLKADQTILLKVMPNEHWFDQLIKSANPQQHEFITLSNELQRQAFLFDGETIVPIVPDQWIASSRPLLKELLQAEARLSSYMHSGYAKTHLQRLELISKALGHRNWHAVQGMAANNR